MQPSQDKKSQPKPRPSGDKDQKQRDSEIDVSVEDRGYNPYDVTPRDDETTRRRHRDKWSF